MIRRVYKFTLSHYLIILMPLILIWQMWKIIYEIFIKHLLNFMWQMVILNDEYLWDSFIWMIFNDIEIIWLTSEIKWNVPWD